MTTTPCELAGMYNLYTELFHPSTDGLAVWLTDEGWGRQVFQSAPVWLICGFVPETPQLHFSYGKRSWRSGLQYCCRES